MSSRGRGEEEYEKLVNEGLTKLLSVEGKVLRSLLKEVRKQEQDLLPSLCGRNDGVVPEEARAWWASRKGGLPESMRFLDSWLQAGLQPVFCALSFCFRSSSPTCYLPVPYMEVTQSAADFIDTLVLNGSDVPLPALDDIEKTARELSHALLNISYEVRLNDDPAIGYLAKAYKNPRSLYIPDVGVLESPVSAAQEEERFLGMASVLYLPVVGESLPGIALDTGTHAPVVLMLWSPTPRRWDHLPKERDQDDKNVFHITLPELFPELLASKLARFADGHLHLENAHAFADALFVGLLFTLDRVLNDLGEAGQVVRERLMHGFLDLRDELFRFGGTKAPG